MPGHQIKILNELSGVSAYHIPPGRRGFGEMVTITIPAGTILTKGEEDDDYFGIIDGKYYTQIVLANDEYEVIGGGARKRKGRKSMKRKSMKHKAKGRSTRRR